MEAERGVIQGISSIHTIISPSVTPVTRGGKRAVPVRPIYSLQARFKHVVGVPSRSPDRQVPLDKLRILDNVIDRLIHLRGSRGEVIPVTQENADGLIQQFQRELHTVARASRPLFTGLFPDTGTVVNLLA